MLSYNLALVTLCHGLQLVLIKTTRIGDIKYDILGIWLQMRAYWKIRRLWPKQREAMTTSG